MAGGGARRESLAIHYVAGHRRPLLDRGSPETEQGPAVTNPRIREFARPTSSAAAPCHARLSPECCASEPIGGRTLMPSHLETGHESGSGPTLDSRRHGQN